MFVMLFLHQHSSFLLSLLCEHWMNTRADVQLYINSVSDTKGSANVLKINLIAESGCLYILYVENADYHGKFIAKQEPALTSIIVGSSLCTLKSLNLPFGVYQASQLVNAAIANAIFAHCAFCGKTPDSTPGAAMI